MGGFNHVDPEDEQMLMAAEFATQYYIKQQSAFFDALSGNTEFFKVVEAEYQIVAGIKYKMLIEILGGDLCVTAFSVNLWKNLEQEYEVLEVSEKECNDVNDVIEAGAIPSASKNITTSKHITSSAGRCNNSNSLRLFWILVGLFFTWLL